MRILVTGSRDWTNGTRIRKAILMAALEERVTTRSQITVVHGGARGADQMAETIARGLGMQTERHPADWEKYGRRAGFIRNDEMVKLGADVCLAFIKNQSKGATMCSRLAEEAGMRTVRYVE